MDDQVLRNLPNTAAVLAERVNLTAEAVGQRLRQYLAQGVVGRTRNDPVGRGRPSFTWFLVREPDPLPRKECAVCKLLKMPREFFACREGSSLCCIQCSKDRAEEVALARRRAVTATASLRRVKGEGTLDPLVTEYMEILGRDPCSYCGGSMRLIDHIEPLSKTGQHEWSNLTPACGSCNAQKSSQSLLTFLCRRTGTLA
jgi:hypothetical protein